MKSNPKTLISIWMFPRRKQPKEATEEAGSDELDLTGLGATIDMDAAPEAEEADAEEVDLSTLDEELDVAAEPAGKLLRLQKTPHQKTWICRLWMRRWTWKQTDR